MRSLFTQYWFLWSNLSGGLKFNWIHVYGIFIFLFYSFVYNWKLLNLILSAHKIPRSCCFSILIFMFFFVCLWCCYWSLYLFKQGIIVICNLHCFVCDSIKIESSVIEFLLNVIQSIDVQFCAQWLNYQKIIEHDVEYLIDSRNTCHIMQLWCIHKTFIFYRFWYASTLEWASNCLRNLICSSTNVHIGWTYAL